MGTDQVRIDSLGASGAGKVPIVMVVNPLNPIFGTAYDSDPYVTRIEGSNVEGTYNGQELKNTSFTYSLTWWDRATGGDTIVLGRDQYVGGGVIDYWKVIVKVYDAGSVVYEQIVNVRLAVLDMTPNKNKFYDAASTSVVGGVKGAYAKDDYQGRTNPYGDNYASLISALNQGLVNEGVTESTKYFYKIIKWGEYTICNSVDENGDHICDNCGNPIEEGKTKRMRYSEEVEIYNEDGLVLITTIYTDLFQTVLIS
jgi:hypothetical protein